MTEPVLAKYIRWLVYASALVPLVIFAQYMSPFHFGKVVILRSIIEIMAVLYVLLIWRDRSYRPVMHPISWAFLGFALVFTLTTITSVAPTQSFVGTLERMGGLWTFWHYFVFFIIAVSVMRTREHWTRLLDLVIAVGLVSAVYGFLQKTNWSFILGAGGRARPFGTIGNAALFAGYQILVAYLGVTLLAMKKFGPRAQSATGLLERGNALIGGGLGAALLLALLFAGHGLWIIPFGVVFYGIYLVMAGMGWGLWFYRGAVGLMFLAAISTAVRGSLLAIVVGTIVYVLLWSVLNRSRQAKIALLVAIAGVVVFFFLALLFRNTPVVKGSPYLTRITDFSSSTFTVQTRFWAWSAGLKGWSEAPRYMALGWGPENFNVPFSKYFNPKFFTGPGSETFFDRAHNMFIEVLVTMGVLGELAYLALFGVLLWTLIGYMKRQGDDRALGIGLTALTVAYAIHNAFIFDTSANFLVFFTIVAFIVHVAQRGLDGANSEKRIANRGKGAKEGSWTAGQMAVGGMMAIAAIVLVYATNVKQTMANYAVTRGIVAGWKGDFVGAVEKYRQAIDYGVPGQYEFRHRFAQYVLEVASGADTSTVPQFDAVVSRVLNDLKANSEENPSDYLPLLYASRIYLSLGQDDPRSPANDAALEQSTRALEISPTFVRTYYEVAQAYLNKKEYGKAYEWFGKAAELNPDVSLTYWYMGAVLIQKGANEKKPEVIRQGLQYAFTALRKGYVLGEEDAQKLVNAYMALDDLKNVAALYQQIVKNFPQRPDYWEQLIAVYLKMGNSQGAIQTIQTALTQPDVGDNPAFRTKAANTLRDLGVQ
jgi:tetratricopeptide (TPR) repeat protein